MDTFTFIIFWLLAGYVAKVLCDMMSEEGLCVEDLWKDLRVCWLGPILFIFGMLVLLVEFLDKNRYKRIFKIKRRKK